jgi:hypothetical protein
MAVIAFAEGRVLRLPLTALELGERRAKLAIGVRSQACGRDLAHEVDDLTHLIDVVGTVRAAGEVRLQAPALVPSQRRFEVVRDELGNLFAGE